MYCTADPRRKYGFGDLIRAPRKLTPSSAQNIYRAMSSPRLLDQVRTVIRVKHFSLSTERAYVSWITRFILFHHKRHPKKMAEPEIRQFIFHLAVDARISASTQTVALSAPLFLYRDVLKQELPYIDNIERAKSLKTLPVVFTRREVQAVIARLDGTHYLQEGFGKVCIFPSLLLRSIPVLPENGPGRALHKKSKHSQLCCFPCGKPTAYRKRFFSTRLCLRPGFNAQ